LKRVLHRGGREHAFVAPRRGAWIETLISQLHLLMKKVAPRRGAWIETSMINRCTIIPARRAPQGRVD